jgi:tetratricopeptide (TPR) repeat protein
MISRTKRVVVVAGACLLWLTGCETTSMKLPDIFSSKDFNAQDPVDTSASIEKSAEPDTTGTVSSTGPDLAIGSGEQTNIVGSDPNDNLNLGKRHFRAQDYGLAERYFRRAVELAPRDSEAWLGLAASYDRLRRFDLADRAYSQLLKILGPTPEVLNNQGYSYMLRGDYRRARQILRQAQVKAPDNPYVRNNLDLLARSQVNRKGIE